MPTLLDLLFIFVNVVFIVLFIDVFLLLIIWRVKRLNANINRRRKEKEVRDNLTEEERDRFYAAPW